MTGDANLLLSTKQEVRFLRKHLNEITDSEYFHLVVDLLAIAKKVIELPAFEEQFNSLDDDFNFNTPDRTIEFVVSLSHELVNVLELNQSISRNFAHIPQEHSRLLRHLLQTFIELVEDEKSNQIIHSLLTDREIFPEGSNEIFFHSFDSELFYTFCSYFDERSEIVLWGDSAATNLIHLLTPERKSINNVKVYLEGNSRLHDYLKHIVYLVDDNEGIDIFDIEESLNHDLTGKNFIVNNIWNNNNFTSSNDYRKRYFYSKTTTKVKSQDYYLLRAIEKNTNKLIAFMPANFLSAGGSTKLTREYILKSMQLKKVLHLPPILFSSSKVSSAVCLFDATKIPDSVVYLSDFDQDFRSSMKSTMDNKKSIKEFFERSVAARSIKLEADSAVRYEEIENNEFDFSPNRYRVLKNKLNFGERKHVRLEELVEILRLTPFKQDDDNGEKCIELLMKDIDKNGMVTKGGKVRLVNGKNWPKVEKVMVKTGDILLGVKGTIGKVGFIQTDSLDNHFVGQSMVLIRIKKQDLLSEPIYLFRYLLLPDVQSYMNALSVGTNVRSIRSNDLLNMNVPIPDENELLEVKRAHNEITRKKLEALQLLQQADQISKTCFNFDD